MDKETRKRLAEAGFRIGTSEEFLQLTDEERQMVELRLMLSRAIRERRQQLGMTQKQLASKLKSSQSRVAKIEAAAEDVSLDLSFRSLFVVGCGLADVTRLLPRTAAKKRKASTRPPPRRRRVIIKQIANEL